MEVGMAPRINYVEPATIKDEAMLAELDRCYHEGTPRPESQAIRAHVPAAFWSFANTWRDVFHNGVADHNIKDASMAPGFETMNDLIRSKSNPNYWANGRTLPKSSAA
jgi:hypothetical protein